MPPQVLADCLHEILRGVRADVPVRFLIPCHWVFETENSHPNRGAEEAEDGRCPRTEVQALVRDRVDDLPRSHPSGLMNGRVKSLLQICDIALAKGRLICLDQREPRFSLGRRILTLLPMAVQVSLIALG